MYTPPTTLCGTTAIVARPGAAPVVLGTASVGLSGGRTARLEELKWALKDFAVEDPELDEVLADGSVHTFMLYLSSAQLHLVQQGSSFWTSCLLDVEPRQPPSAGPGGTTPLWRKRSERRWPYVAGNPVPFVAQAHLGGADVYLFEMESGAVLLHRVARFEQDVENHYDEEERRDNAV
jgi:hypothetical protein